MTTQKSQTNFLKFYYFFIFFGPGSLFPLLSVYLQDEINLSGTQIGMVMAVGPIVGILMQPVWGIAADYKQNPKLILTCTLFISSLMGLIYSFSSSYTLVLGAAVLLFIPFSAINPLSDSIAVSYSKKLNAHFGDFRLWGALGYALAAVIIGRLVEWSSFSIIFYSFILSILISAIISFRLPAEREEEARNKLDKQSIRRLLVYPKFSFFLIATFFTFGPMDANNTYFGLYIIDLGGTVASVGLAWFLIAGFEVPFMKFSGFFIRKFGALNVMIIAAVASSLRYILYYFAPSLTVVFLSTIIQGFAFALCVTASLHYVVEISGKEVKNSAVALYSTVAYGLGNFTFTIIGGFLYDHFGIYNMYLSFGLITIFGISMFLLLRNSSAEDNKIGVG
ncbi:MFS transporter [Virgibacillus flavescens]|uniref:MFS transporter n=1 Tax=Virgibacillus flavescens TaxID=1611422 RepID=UPI003D352B0B